MNNLTFIDYLAERSSAVLNALDSPGGERLNMGYDIWIEDLTRKLRKATETHEIYRLQGMLDALHRVRNLRAEVSEVRRLMSNNPAKK